MSEQQYKVGLHPDLPPPKNMIGPVAWLHQNLFATATHTVLTLLSIWSLYLIVPPVLSWGILDATLQGSSRVECRAIAPDGACWSIIRERFSQFVYGFYPHELRWRVDLTFLLLVLAVIPVLFEKVPFRKYGLYYAACFPFIGAWLLVGGGPLEAVDTSYFGGFMLTLILGVTGISFSLPIGIMLALARQSSMPVLRTCSIMFIEFIRGVPLITLLFIASTMLSYFLPPGKTFDLLLRVLIMVVLFASAYVAEVIRGGLQSIPKGQVEAGDAMGLSYWQSMRFIILPQALKISIPGIVNSFIGLYKDTTLVMIIGLFDPLGIGRGALANSEWAGLHYEVFIFVSLFFFISCFAMSRYSIYLENKLHTGYKR